MAGKPRILCVDDQPENVRIRAMLLEQFGCEVTTVADHQGTLQAVSSQSFDLLVIDYHLAHGETGEEIARDIRVMRPDLPLVMLTGDSKLPESASESVDAVLIKGMSNPRALLDMVEKLVPGSKLRPRRPPMEPPAKVS